MIFHIIIWTVKGLLTCQTIWRMLILTSLFQDFKNEFR